MIRQLRSSTFAIVILAIVVAVAITLPVHRLNPEVLGDWLRTLAATSISALFAVAIGVGLFKEDSRLLMGGYHVRSAGDRF